MFSPLNLKTIYSDSLIEIKELFDKAVKEGSDKVVINDNGSLHYCLEVGKLVNETGIEAILGVTFPFQLGKHVVNLTVYPKTNKGKKYLYKMSSAYFRKEKRSFQLEKMKVIFDEMNVVVDSKGLKADELEYVLKLLLKESISKRHLFVGLHETFNQKNKLVNQYLEKVIVSSGVEGYVAFNPVMYLEEEQFETYQYYTEIKGNEKPQGIENVYFYEEDVEEMFSYLAIQEQTLKIMEGTRVSYALEKSGVKIPAFIPTKNFEVHQLFNQKFDGFVKTSTKEEVLSASYLFYLVMEGTIARYGKDKIAVERALYELDLIINKKFSDYFLIVQDFMDYLKRKGEKLGPGRGSVVSSIVAYSLNITEINPLPDNLQFERFLNKYREDYPDMDIDMEEKTRVLLVQYLKNKYGEQHVAQIMTRTNYGFKNAMNQLLKIMVIPGEKVEKLLSYQPDEFPTFQKFLIDSNEECLEFIASSKDIEKLLYHAFALKGLPQGTSKHASGFVISQEPLEEEIPMMYEDGVALTQVPNTDNILETVGLLKFDLLVVKSLSVINETRNLIELRTGKMLNDIPVNDENAIQLFAQKHTSGIFQFEAASRFCGEWMTSFSDVLALNALNRPGPMKQIPTFIEQKGKTIQLFDSKGEPLKDVEVLYPILKETYGIIVYQEQINEIAHVWAGYHLAQAEAFRRAISHKNEVQLLDQKEIFLKKSLENNRDEHATHEIFKLILRFAEYGYNKGHALGYAKMAMNMAYLKANYPVEFMTSLLNSIGTKTNKCAEYIQEARRMGVEILRPDINESYGTFEVERHAIRTGLAMIKDIGLKTAKALCDARGTVKFKNIEDVLNRIQNVSGVDRSNIEKLIKVGALDSIGERNEMLKHFHIESNGPMTLGDKIVLEMEMSKTIFSIDGVLQKQLIEKSKNEENVVVGIVMNISVRIDRYEKNYAKIELLTFEGYTKYLMIFSSQWKVEKDNVSVGSILIGKTNEKILKEMKILNF